MMLTESDNPPDPSACRSEQDAGRLHFDRNRHIWYECLYDKRTEAYTWAIIPPVEP